MISPHFPLLSHSSLFFFFFFFFFFIIFFFFFKETANVMYSLALMTYDAPYGVTPNTIKTRAQLKDHQTSMDALWGIHRMVLMNFKEINPLDYNKENYDQYGMFFEMMRVVPGGNALVMDVLNRIPRTTGNTLTLSTPHPPLSSSPTSPLLTHLSSLQVPAVAYPLASTPRLCMP